MLSYKLPHPLTLLKNPLPKETFRKLVKLLTSPSKSLGCHCPPSQNSLSAFSNLSLTQPHQLLVSAGCNQYEVAKALIQIKFLCAKYPCGERTKHWPPDNPEGLCSYSSCQAKGQVESPEHILLEGPAYIILARQSLLNPPNCNKNHEYRTHTNQDTASVGLQISPGCYCSSTKTRR